LFSLQFAENVLFNALGNVFGHLQFGAADEKRPDSSGQAAARHPKLRLVCLPHDGPTSKADCLNWICRAIEEEEQSMGQEFAGIVLHDAEDLIHPDELGLFNSRLDEAHFLQLPVLALPTPPWDLTHGVYCDDFAESQSKDLPTRQLAGAFVPGCGVGTALRRDTLRHLAASYGEVFDPHCLTEDYDLGLRAFKLGLDQIFLPLLFDRGGPVATREYFPRRWRQAVRQRSRWIKGYLQTWLVHMRHPLILWRELGPGGFVGFQLLLGGTVLVLLLNPLFWALVPLWFATRSALLQQLFPGPVFYLGATALYVGNILFIYLAMAGSLGRGYHALTKYALLSPVYWVLMSVAAWKGALQLICRPHYWEKTRHGLARFAVVPAAPPPDATVTHKGPGTS